jgi:hypothetical protein
LAINFRTQRINTSQSSELYVKHCSWDLSIAAVVSYGYCKRPWRGCSGRVTSASSFIRSAQGIMAAAYVGT